MGALIACVVFIVYTATSGLFGVIYTDVFQFVMLILFVYILIPSASLVKLGGLSVFLEGLAPELAKPYLDGGIVGDIITYFVFTLAGAEMWQRAFAAKSQKAAKEGLFLGTLAYGLTIPLVWFMGVVAHQLVSAEKLAQYGSTDAVVPALAIEILPVGLTGLALAGILFGVVYLIYLNAIHEKEIATKLQKDLGFGMTVYSGLAGAVIGILQFVLYAGASSELVWVVIGGLLNFAAGLPIYLSFKKGIFYGVQ